MKKIIIFLWLIISLSSCSETIYLGKIGSAIAADYSQVAEKGFDWSIICSAAVPLLIVALYWLAAKPKSYKKE